ncbi:MAG: precorrin-2 C(20)-methyltransferase, partial [Proteobacteria bacterium]|nr:precorrin-2 C(20)-methyltransferase [Pseudomonadota bacterium]
MSGATLYVVGLGPGAPDLVTLRAARVLGSAPCHAFFAKRGRAGHAATIARPHLRAESEALRFDYPYTTELSPHDPEYRAAMAAFYEDAAGRIAARLEAGQDVALLCEGDAFFYGSAMYVFDHLAGRFRVEVVPGLPAMSGAWAAAGLPVAHG